MVRNPKAKLRANVSDSEIEWDKLDVEYMLHRAAMLDVLGPLKLITKKTRVGF